MKKLLLLSFAGLTLVACGSNGDQGGNANQNQSQPQSQPTEQVAGTQEQETSQQTSQQNNQVQAPASNQNQAGPLDLSISFDDAAASYKQEFSDAPLHELSLEFDDGRWEYHLEGETAEEEYELTLNAENGEVIERETDHNDDYDERPSLDLGQVLSLDEVLNKASENGIDNVEEISLYMNQSGDPIWKVEDRLSDTDLILDGKTGDLLARDVD